jgi:DNA repair photolyase
MPADSTITISNSSDPYQPLEEKLRLTRSALEIMKDYEINLLIVTKSDLVTRDVDILQKFKKKVIAITLTTIDPALAGKLEPGAASPQKRLAAIKKLSGMIPIILRLDPLVYPLNTSNLDGIIKEAKLAGVKQIVTSTYKAKADNFKRMVKAFPEHSRLWNDLYIKEGKKRSNYLYLAKSLREKLIKKVRDIALAQGLEFSSCREGFSELNTAACDGSSWL